MLEAAAEKYALIRFLPVYRLAANYAVVAKGHSVFAMNKEDCLGGHLW